jgi:hypothetical protein
MNLDGTNGVQYVHVPIASLYLQIARDHAQSAKRAPDDEQALKDSIVAVALAVMSIEALINQIAEEVIPDAERNDFIRFKGPFRSKSGSGSSIKNKLVALVARRTVNPIDAGLLTRLEALVSLRNDLVHYKLMDTARKVIMCPVKPSISTEGVFSLSINLLAKPERVEAPLIEKLTPGAAVEAANVALEIFRLWCELDDALDQIAHVEPLTPAP